MNSEERDTIFEYLILGSGAGGATAFLEFASESTLLLEEGSEISQSDLRSSEVTRIRNFYRNGGIRPALGFPSVAIGEGFCLGGSTEINGGLFWRTPPGILAQWKSEGDHFANSDQVSKIFLELEDELGVIQESAPDNTDADSRLMLEGSRNLNFKVVPARRMVRGCKKANQCPSGCPNGAKQSMSKTFISQGKEKGGKVITGLRASKIVPNQDFVQVECINALNETLFFKSKNVIVSCGAIESRRLLQRSNLVSKKVGKIQFHGNTKIFAKYDSNLNADRGTIFTHQVQEFMEDGFLLMPANFSLSYLAFGSGNLSTEAYREIVKDFPKYAMFTGQFRFSGKILDIKLGKKRSLLLSYLTKSDVRMLRKYLLKTAEILFASGARKILIPTTGTNEVESYAHAERIINRINRLSISISTVHIMSSMPIRRMKSDVLNAKGQLKADSRIYVMDASILPSSIGESPQGTIMAYVRFLIRHQKEIRTS